MSDVLVRIKRAVLDGRYRFTDKADIELEADGLTERDVLESIMNAVAVYKTLRSRSPQRRRPGERLYIIQSTNLEGGGDLHQGHLSRRGRARDVLPADFLEALHLNGEEQWH